MLLLEKSNLKPMTTIISITIDIQCVPASLSEQDEDNSELVLVSVKFNCGIVQQIGVMIVLLDDTSMKFCV